MVHGLFHKPSIKTDLDYYKWHWSKLLECNGPTDEKDKQNAFQKHRNLHRLVQAGTPRNSIYCFLTCALNSVSFATFISISTSSQSNLLINTRCTDQHWPVSLSAQKQNTLLLNCFPWTLLGESFIRAKLYLSLWVWRRNASCRPVPSSKSTNTIERPSACPTSEELWLPQEE